MISSEEQAELLKLRQMKHARDSFEGFIEFTMPSYEMSWFHQTLAAVLQEFVFSDHLNRLMVFAPPRHGKSQQISRHLPAYILGHFPKANIISCSYGADLARMMNRDVQRIIDSELYRKVFPQTFLSNSRVKTVTGNWLRNADMFETVGFGGQYIASGRGGGVTGKGAGFLLLDDLIKNGEEARSKVFRDAAWEFYAETAYTRMENPNKICIINTRWHEDDICGRILQQARTNPEADQWTVVSFPAISDEDVGMLDVREPGQALWPERYDIDRLKKIRATVGNSVFTALFQQRPAPAEGGIFKKHYWQFYDGLPECETIIQSWDMAFKKTDTSDFVACLVIGKKAGNFYVLDYLKERMDINDTLKAVNMMSKKWPQARTKLVEDKANGSAVIDLLRNKIPGLKPVEPKGGKEVRANAIAPFQESGNVYLPRPYSANWVQEFIDTCASFPAVAHDDDVDAFTQGILHLGGSTTERLERLLHF